MSDGDHDPVPPRRHRVAARGVSAYPQGWRDGRRRTDRGGVRGEPGGEPPVAARTRAVRDVPGTAEDKVLQRAVAMVLEAVCEQDFLDCRYGFRPGRSAHQAPESLWRQTTTMGGGWVVELDIRKFLDTLDRSHLRTIPSRRVRDGVLARLPGKWLNAGVLEAGELSFPDAGTPQGGATSPLLANVYLHGVLDVWFERMVKPVMHGAAFLHRYADDAVMVFAGEADARRRKRAWCRSGAQRCRKRRHDPIPSNTAAAVGSCEGTTGTMASLGTR